MYVNVRAYAYIYTYICMYRHMGAYMRCLRLVCVVPPGASAASTTIVCDLTIGVRRPKAVFRSPSGFIRPIFSPSAASTMGP